MSPFLLALIIATAPGAQAEGEATTRPGRVFKLERQPLMRADTFSYGGSQAPTRPLDGLPPGVSGFGAVGSELCFTRQASPLHKVVLTKSSRRQARHDRLYFDSDGDGKFAESECHDLSRSQGPVKIKTRRSKVSEVIVQPLKVLNGQGASAPFHWIAMRVWLPSRGQPGLGYAIITYLVAEATFGGKTRRLAVYALRPFDATDGYDRRVSWGEMPAPDKRKYIKHGFRLLLDVNGNGTFDQTGSDAFGLGPERMQTTRLQRVDGAYWEVAVAPDGRSVRVTPASPEVGTLAIPEGIASGSVLGPEFGACIREGDKALELPVGCYLLVRYQYCTSAASFTARDYYMAACFEIRPGQTTSLEAGPPLQMKITHRAIRSGPRRGRRSSEQVGISLAMQDCAGRPLLSAQTDKGRKPSPPRFKILSPSGRKVLDAAFKYG